MCRDTLGTGKVEDSSTSLKFLSIILDTIQIEALLPANKLQRTIELVSTWIFRRATKGEIVSLIGVLQHATTIVQPGRTFLCRMYATADKLQELHFYTRPNKEFLSGLSWWDNYCSKFEWLNFAPMHNYTNNCSPRLQYSDKCVRFLELRGLLSGKIAATRVAPSMVHRTHQAQ